MIRPIDFRQLGFCPQLCCANQTFPSGPAVMNIGELCGVDVPNVRTLPFSVIRPILLAANSMNQRLPSCPAAIPVASWTWNFVTLLSHRYPDR